MTKFALTVNNQRCRSDCLTKLVDGTAGVSTRVFGVDVLHVQSNVTEVVHCGDAVCC